MADYVQAHCTRIGIIHPGLGIGAHSPLKVDCVQLGGVGNVLGALSLLRKPRSSCQYHIHWSMEHVGALVNTPDAPGSGYPSFLPSQQFVSTGIVAVQSKGGVEYGVEWV